MILENSPTPDISGSDTWLIQDGQQIVNFVGGQPDDLRYFIVTGPGAVIFSNEDIKLESGVNYSPTIGDTFMLIFDGEKWYEISRSLNPLYSGIVMDEYQMDNAYIERQIELIKQQMASNMEYCMNNILDLQHQINQINFGGTVNDSVHLVYDPTNFSTLQSDINNLGKYLMVDVVIEFLPGTYTFNGHIVFNNFNGPGSIIVTGPSDQYTYSQSKNTILDATGINHSLFNFHGCNCALRVGGLQIYHNNSLMDGNDGGISFRDCPNFETVCLSINNMGFVSHGIYSYKSNGYIADCYFQRGYSAIYADNLSRLSIKNCDDYNFAPNYGLFSTSASYIGVLDNQFPDGTVEDVHQEKGSMIVV